MTRLKNWILGPVLWMAFLGTSSADIVDSKGRPLPEVAKIFKMFSGCLSSAQALPKEVLGRLLSDPQNASVEDLTALSQEKFLRPSNTERSEALAYTHYHRLAKCLKPGQKSELLELFRKLGNLDAVSPKSKSFDYILINGSTVQDMRNRIMVVAHAVQDGIIEMTASTQIVFLDGERKLYSSETEQVLRDPSPYKARADWKSPVDLPTDEREASEFVWKQLDLPPALKEKTALFIHAEKKLRARRAETEDCVMKWAKKFSPKPGRALIVSTNPYVYYQTLVTQLLLGQSGLGAMQLESIGKASDLTSLPEDGDIGILLDNLARTFYSYLRVLRSGIKKAA